MAIKMTLRQGIAAYQALEAMPRLPNGKISYTLGYIADKLEGHCRQFEKQREKMKREMAEADKDGRLIIPAAKLEELNAALEEMIDVEIEIGREPVKLADVLGTDPAKAPEIEPRLMRALQSIIVE